MDKFILDKTYRYSEEGMSLDFISTAPENLLELQLAPKSKQAAAKMRFQLESVAVKGITSKGVRITAREVKKIVHVKS